MRVTVRSTQPFRTHTEITILDLLRQYFQWYDGFVPNFHNHHHGIFSSRLAYTVLHKLAEQTTGARILFEDNGEMVKHYDSLKTSLINVPYRIRLHKQPSGHSQVATVYLS